MMKISVRCVVFADSILVAVMIVTILTCRLKIKGNSFTEYGRKTLEEWQASQN